MLKGKRVSKTDRAKSKSINEKKVSLLKRVEELQNERDTFIAVSFTMYTVIVKMPDKYSKCKFCSMHHRFQRRLKIAIFLVFSMAANGACATPNTNEPCSLNTSFLLYLKFAAL